MTDLRLIIAEMRANDLLVTLQAAVNGDPHWRQRACQLLLEIYNGILPPPVTEALREVDARKRAAEILNDVACRDAD